MHEIRMQRRFAAPPAEVFAAVTDHERMSDWIHGARVTLDKPGSPSRNGVGAVRRIAARGLTIREEVVRFEEPTAMDYRVIAGAPLRNHLGGIRLRPDGSGTVLDYTIRFEVPWYLGGPLLGAIVARTLKTEIDKGLAALAARID
jgi:carbon monoxide dehydrogenase subunit G